MSGPAPDPERTRALAERALQGSAAEVELFAFAVAERSLQLRLPGAPGETMEAVGARTLWTARVWREGQVGVAVGSPEGEEDLRALIGAATTRAATGRPSARPPPPPAAALAAPAELPPAARSRQQLRELAAPLLGGPGVVQAAVMREVAGHRGLFSTFAPPVLQPLSSTRALLRSELPLGAVVDGASAQGGAPLDLATVHRRLLDAAVTLGERGGEPDPALPFCLSPLAAAPLVEGLAWLLRGDVGGRTAALAKAVGKRVFPAALTVEDGPGAAGLDDEGVPARPVMLVDQGRLQGFLHSAETAAETAAELAGAAAGAPAGRGVRTDGRGAPAPGAMGLTVRGSAAPLPPDCNELNARLETFVSMARPGKVLLRAAGWVRRGGVRVRRIGPVELELPVVESLRLLAGVCGDPEPLAATGPFAAPALVWSSLPGGVRA